MAAKWQGQSRIVVDNGTQRIIVESGGAERRVEDVAGRLLRYVLLAPIRVLRSVLWISAALLIGFFWALLSKR